MYAKQFAGATLSSSAGSFKHKHDTEAAHAGAQDVLGLVDTLLLEETTGVVVDDED